MISTNARAESDATASGYPMTVTGDVAEGASAAPSDPSRDGARAAGPRLGAMSDWAMRVPWLWPALLTAILGRYQLGRPELWRDELASWTFATRPVPDLITTARHADANHMVYYLLLHYWIAAFGDSAVAMRSLSVLAMAGAAACVTLVARRLADTRAGLLAGLAFALVPSVSRFAQEVRSYALEVLVATLATLMLLRALERPAVHRWAAYGVCVAALGYLDPVALAAVTGHAAVVAMRWWRDRDDRVFWFVPAALAGLAAWVPLALISWHEESGQVGWILRPGLDLTVFSFFARNLFYSTSVATAFILLAILAWTVDRRPAAVATALALVPVAAVWLVSQGSHSFFFPSVHAADRGRVGGAGRDRAGPGRRAGRCGRRPHPRPSRRGRPAGDPVAGGPQLDVLPGRFRRYLPRLRGRGGDHRARSAGPVTASSTRPAAKNGR